MSFINKSVNVSQTFLLKSLLKNQLSLYNQHVIDISKSAHIDMFHYIIPNNNIKYYCYVCKKKQIEQTNDATKNFNILYFFPDQFSIDENIHNKNKIHVHSDFYMEINDTFTETLLLEGYMYKNDDMNDFLVSDILVVNDKIIDSRDFLERFTLVNNILNLNILKKINNHMNIGIHPIFQSDKTGFISVFLNNFKFKNEICCMEHVYTNKKQRIGSRTTIDNTTCLVKRISKGSYADVYKVHNVSNNNNEGILFVKGISESRKMKELLKFEANIELPCKYNNTFKKWEPIFE